MCNTNSGCGCDSGQTYSMQSSCCCGGHKPLSKKKTIEMLEKKAASMKEQLSDIEEYISELKGE